MVICKARYGDWNPFFRDGMYDAEGSMGEEIREWPDYKVALEIIRRMIKRMENEQNDPSGCLLRSDEVDDQR